MIDSIKKTNNVPLNFPQKNTGKLTYKIIIKKDYIRANGTCALYVQIFLHQRKRLPLNIAVKPSEFNIKLQRVNKTSKYYKDYNLLIEKKLSDINKIEVYHRLQNTYLTLSKLLEELESPTNKEDFLIFFRNELENQKRILKPNTYKQQKSVLQKLKKFRTTIPFYSIDKKLISDLIYYEKTKLNNIESTIYTTLKSFKKYLGIANKSGIRTSLNFREIKNKTFKGQRTYLNKEELIALNNYWKSETINITHYNVLSRFLFSCFTGLRISDIQSISKKNLIDKALVFTSIKTGKFQRIRLNKTASYISTKIPFFGKYTDQYINRVLKEICATLEIKKAVSFHVARHTMATQYLINGGAVQNLQKILAHSNIRETMIYVHIVDSVLDDEIDFMDAILEEPT